MSNCKKREKTSVGWKKQKKMCVCIVVEQKVQPQ